MSKLKKVFKKLNNSTKRRRLQLYLFALFIKRHLVERKKGSLERPGIWLDLNDDYVRYSYILSKLFEIEGYQVYMKTNLRFLLKLTDLYSMRILTEGSIILSKEKPPSAIAAFCDRRVNAAGFKFVSNNYFSTIFDKDPNSFHIPIGLHPNMYSTGLWNAPVDTASRKHSVFFAGNFNERLYEQVSEHEKFSMPNRIEIKKMLQSLPTATFPKTYDGLVKNSKDAQIDIVELANFQVPQKILRQTIAGYSFFIACPGFIMPLSHNIFEAMSVGTIPIIHRQYARMFFPELEDYSTAILYDNDFIAKIQEVLLLDRGLVSSMHEEVINYYNRYLTPKAIVEQLIKPEINTYYLNAEWGSVVIMQ
jgi:hypothetical protein